MSNCDKETRLQGTGPLLSGNWSFPARNPRLMQFMNIPFGPFTKTGLQPMPRSASTFFSRFSSPMSQPAHSHAPGTP